ncbi:MAG TPA: glucoamylase family protein [Ruminiclostridium sp.]|nr:glucoamylase family protein [Ruminiclostridium sp.]
MNISIILIIILLAIIIGLSRFVFKNRLSYDIQIEDVVLNSDDLIKHAEQLAKSQITYKSRSGINRIKARIERNFQRILETYQKFNEDVSASFPVPPAAEWLLDNFYIIDEQKSMLLKELSESRKALPVISEGAYAGFPRIFAIAADIVSHSDGNINEKNIKDFIFAYQRYTFLSIQELWMLSTMIKAALLEKLWSVCDKMYSNRQDWYKADSIVNGIRHNNENCDDFKSHIGQLDELTPAFVEHLIRKLRKEGSKTLWMIECLDSILIQKSTSTDNLISEDHFNQASLQVSIGNIIGSFRTLSSFDNTVLFEELSEVERILKLDPSGVYPQMDFNSRNYYRDIVMKLGDRYRTTEINIARLCCDLARERFDQNPSVSPEAHVGYYLAGEGRGILYARLGGRKELSFEGNEGWYISAIVVLSVIIALFPTIQGIISENRSLAIIVLITGILSIIPASEIVVAIVNSCISRVAKPSRLPKLELKEGIPEEWATMVIIPALVPNVKRTLALINNLEVYYLANKGGNIYFSLAGDFKDSDEESLTDDNEITRAAINRINQLNSKYRRDGNPVFYFFCRKRSFNEKQHKWLGWERKRGAILEFNRLLRGDKNTGYIYNSADISKIPHIKYVITLDADTQLPLETAKQLVGAMAHPLNKAYFDVEKGTVTKGYGILQPRIDVNIESAGISLFTRVFAGQGGIDPYTTTVSDVYQDAFGEGIFTGKGIYDVDVFQMALDKTIPENSVLSHDLLEGSLLRTGLVTDIELIDGYPGRYNSFMMRLHRWTRGDWQLLPWIFERNPLSVLSRWKMIDNLRRSLIYPVLALIIILATCVFRYSSRAWFALALISLCAPVLSYLVQLLLVGNYKIYVAKRRITIITGLRAILLQVGLLLTFLPYQAGLMFNAIFKSIGRVYITKRNLLEWITAADMELSLKNSLESYYRKMWFSPVYGAAILLLSFAYRKEYLVGAIAAFILWMYAPRAAYLISLPTGRKKNFLDAGSLGEVRLLARKTWCYFDEYASREENYLPADNFQEEPFKGAAHRTSPTNIGLLLVSNLAARDMGYISTPDFIERTENTINTVEKMEKWNGHLFNWYNTVTLEVLRPKFISTVDSGNLIGYLMVIYEGLSELKETPAYDYSSLEGLFDLLEICNIEIDPGTKYFDVELLKKLVNSENIEESFKSLIPAVERYLSELEEGKKSGYWLKKLENWINSYKTEFEKYNEKLFTVLKGIPQEITRLEQLQSRVQQLIDGMDFKNLFDPGRNLFSIGFDVEDGHASKSYYDLFASEARQTSLIAIARGEAGRQHWFKLGRKLVKVNGIKGLASWTGTMFEYLMPRLLIKSYPNTLIDKTYEFVVKTQIKYGLSNKTPWGISESCYYAFDIGLNYQYRAFGVPQLGLKRGLANDLVAAPYATVMAIDIAPEECVENIHRFRDMGAIGNFGLYEAVDFTSSRLNKDQTYAVVKCYMVHHQGMSMLAMVNFLKKNIMQERFHRNPQIKAVDSLLQEKYPAAAVINKEFREQPAGGIRKQANIEETVIREYEKLSTYPNMHLLSNGSYYMMITDKGSGYGKLHTMSVYRWINDYMQSSGAFIYIRNVNSNEFWSTTYNPTNTRPEAYKVVFAPHKAEFIRREGNIETNTEVIISSEDNTEVRRVSIHNHSSSKRVIELTSYMEAVLTQPEADLAHPAFSKLFVKTEYVDEYKGLLAMRRKRDDIKQTTWGYHIASTNGKIQGHVEYETDRSLFIGRNRDLAHPRAMEPDRPLSNSVGPVIDPVFSLRIRVVVEPGDSTVVNFCMGACDSRKAAVEMLAKYSDPSAADRVIEMAWTRSRVEAGFINVGADDEKAYLRLLPRLIYGMDRRDQAEYILKNSLSQSDLWPFGISGDLPIVLVTVKSRDSFDEVDWALKLHDFYRIKGIVFDLVILLTDEESYIQPVFEMIRDMAVSGRSYELLDKRGGIFIRNSRQMNEEQKNLLFACAKIIIDADQGVPSLMETIKSMEEAMSLEMHTQGNTAPETPAAGTETGKPSVTDAGQSMDANEELLYFNGYGGFARDGKEYVITLRSGMNTPAPWVNVIANERFGFICTESGGGFTWHLNSSQNKLTTWINDPVMDTPSEIIYLHNPANSKVWSCTPLPVREKEPYTVRHGFGYTCFQHKSNGVEQTLIQFTAVEASTKFSILRLKNITEKEVRLDAAYYFRPVLGTDFSHTSSYIVTDFDDKAKAILIDNVYSADFRKLRAYLSCSENTISYTGSRLDFFGADMDITNPAGMRRELRTSTGAGLDTCAALKTSITLAPGVEKEIVFLLGQDTAEKVGGVINELRDIAQAKNELAKAKDSWNKRLSQIQVNTPDQSINLLLNGWLQYQVLSCRIWARSGFYQAGGAFGFRDQLQDVMAVVYSLPELTKNQILLHCRHQFVEGDVQHWWHNQKMNGIRTRYSDDLLWLPYVTCDYINATGDFDILSLVEPYITSPILGENEHERYEIPGDSGAKGTVYEHCIRAIDHGLTFGVHGIPLMGGGDWNDGMNLVGAHGKGESIWLGWFMYCVLQRIIPICTQMGDTERANTYMERASAIIEAIEKEAWDGSWYRRAYFDDGTPLGSIENDECKIDSLSQSWSAISEAAKNSRVEEAMSAVEKYLIDRKNGLIKLLTPPFYDSDLNPGYIKGYLPGVRENGGQYTHAATWVIYAFSKLGNGERAWELFNMINPVNHARTNTECMTYKVEPYVMAADVYAVYPNEGRGGWTWYTGAAGWMYRIGIDHLLGIKKQGNTILLDPCIPGHLGEYSVRYVYGGSVYNIVVRNPNHKNKTVQSVTLDGKAVESNRIELVDDGGTHEVEAVM